jgi:AcrR family transcriptional regulator
MGADISGRARVARKTFYAHYADKDALLIDCIEPLLVTLAESISNTDVETLLADNKPLSYPAFKHVQEHAAFYRAMLSEHGSARFILYLLDFITHNSYERHQILWQTAPQITVEPMLIAHFLAGALLNTIIWWLKQDCQPAAETMAYTFSQFAAPGSLAALGLD